MELTPAQKVIRDTFQNHAAPPPGEHWLRLPVRPLEAIHYSADVPVMEPTVWVVEYRTKHGLVMINQNAIPERCWRTTGYFNGEELVVAASHPELQEHGRMD